MEVAEVENRQVVDVYGKTAGNETERTEPTQQSRTHARTRIRDDNDDDDDGKASQRHR